MNIFRHFFRFMRFLSSFLWDIEVCFKHYGLEWRWTYLLFWVEIYLTATMICALLLFFFFSLHFAWMKALFRWLFLVAFLYFRVCFIWNIFDIPKYIFILVSCFVKHHTIWFRKLFETFFLFCYNIFILLLMIISSSFQKIKIKYVVWFLLEQIKLKNMKYLWIWIFWWSHVTRCIVDCLLHITRLYWVTTSVIAPPY